MRPDLRRITFIKEEKGGYSKKYRVIAGLCSLLNQLQSPVSIVGFLGDYFQKHLFRHVIGAGAGDHHAAAV